QSEEIIYSNRELEKKFAELETRIEQLSLLTDLSAAVSATLDPEKIYDQTLSRLVDRMAYQRAQLFLVDRGRRVLRGHRGSGGSQRCGPGDDPHPPGPRADLRGQELHRDAAARPGPGARRARGDRGGDEPLPPGGRGSPRRGGQPGGARHR